MNSKSGTSTILKVQVVDLVSYGEDLEVVDGFIDGVIYTIRSKYLSSNLT